MCQIWCQSVQPFGSFQRLLNVRPLKPPSTTLVSRGAICLAYIHSQMVCRCVPNLVPIGPAVCSFPKRLHLWHPTPPPPMPPGVLRGDLHLSYVHSQMNPQTWTKVGANRAASQYFWIVDPLKPPKCPPCVSRGEYPFPYEFAHVCQIWCQSAQSFGRFSRICAKVSSAFRRCTRWLAQKYAKKRCLHVRTELYIDCRMVE